MGRLGVGNSPNPCAPPLKGRRLTASSKSNSGGSSTTTGGRHSDEASTVVLVEAESDEDLVQRLLIVAMIDTLYSVGAIMVGLVIAHILILVWWKFWRNRLYYDFVEPESVRIIRVAKAADTPLGVAIADGGWIKYVSPSTACVHLIAPGDRVHLINGHAVGSAESSV